MLASILGGLLGSDFNAYEKTRKFPFWRTMRGTVLGMDKRVTRRKNMLNVSKKTKRRTKRR